MGEKIVLVDIDGTISKVGDRLKYLQQEPKDWDSFYEACDEDEPIEEMINLVKILDDHYQIVFCTGRRESVREKTMDWLAKHIYYTDITYYGAILLMRPDDDKRHDKEMKPELLERHSIKLENIALVLEDRNSMVSKWRELGLRCLQVADGDF